MIPDTDTDDCQEEPYTAHLAVVNENNPVESTGDIYNDRGVLVLTGGSRIDDAARQHLAGHRLRTPLHLQVSVRHPVAGAALQETFEDLWTRYPDLLELLEGTGDQDEFLRTILGVPLPASVGQHLAVLKQRVPGTFDKALFCGQLCWQLALEMALHPAQVRAAYIAGLSHDMGLLHIPESVLYSQGELTPKQWQVIRGHVSLSYRLILDAGNAVPPLTARAVMEHHERGDGTGYPRGLGAADLHPLGRVVALADSLQAIRAGPLARRRTNLASAVPYLQSNALTHTEAVTRAMFGLLRRSRLEPVPFNPHDGDARAFAAELKTRALAIEGAPEPLQNLAGTAGRGDPLGLVAESLLRILHSSGLLTEALTAWLSEAASTESESVPLTELDTIDLLLAEIAWQLGHLERVASESQQPETTGGRAALKSLSRVLSAIRRSQDAATAGTS